MSKKQYADRDIIELDSQGGHYSKHALAMTVEDLHSKSDIAAELAYRDIRIAKLEGDIQEMIAKAAAKHLGAYREQGVKILALQEALEKLTDTNTYGERASNLAYEALQSVKAGSYEQAN